MKNISRDIKAQALKAGRRNTQAVFRYWGLKASLPTFGILLSSIFGLSPYSAATLLTLSLLLLWYARKSKSKLLYQAYHVAAFFCGTLFQTVKPDFSLLDCSLMTGIYMWLSYDHLKRETRISWIGSVRATIRDELQQEEYKELNRRLGLKP